ncbi:MAG: hypothetical protein H6648_09510 [Caldilineae bacterium]|nr:hypothetical protein [Chloroflexota bacterium]MCB9177384.1 hypothetical protein [Caldilineae bacterium]
MAEQKQRRGQGFFRLGLLLGILAGGLLALVNPLETRSEPEPRALPPTPDTTP